MDNESIKPESAGILDAVLGDSSLWANLDAAEQLELMQSVLNAEVTARQIPLKMKEAEISPPIRVAQIEADAKIKTAQIQADAQVKAAEKAARAMHGWHGHLIWALTVIILAVFALMTHH